MGLIKITEDHYISTRGIKSIRHNKLDEIVVSYITGTEERFKLSDISMSELLGKLGRLPEQKGDTDSA